MEQLINEQGQFTEEFTQKLPEFLGDAYFNDPEKKQPTKAFENVKDLPTLVKGFLEGKRTISKGEAAFAEKTKGMVKVPGQDAKPEEIAAFREAMGVPNDITGYDLKNPEGVSEQDAAIFDGIANSVKAAALEAGIPASALGPVWSKVSAALAAQNADIEAKGQKMMEDDIAAQREEYKEKYPVMISDVQRTFDKCGSEKVKDGQRTIGQQFQSILETFGLLQKDVDGRLTGGHPAVMKFIHEIAPLVIEGKPHMGGEQEQEQPGALTYDYIK